MKKNFVNNFIAHKDYELYLCDDCLNYKIKIYALSGLLSCYPEQDTGINDNYIEFGMKTYRLKLTEENSKDNYSVWGLIPYIENEDFNPNIHTDLKVPSIFELARAKAKAKKNDR